MRAPYASAAGPLFCAALAVPAFGQEADADALRSVARRTEEIRAAAAPSVVSVTVTTRACPMPRLAFPGLVVAPTAQQPQRIEGTGFFLAARNLLVTTRELVADADRIEVRFADGTVRDATLAGVDAPFRLAVLKTSPPRGVAPLPHAERVEASGTTLAWFLGMDALAAGATPSMDVKVTSVEPAPEGAVYDRFLLAPIAIARGAAGGPLLGGDGNVLGMAVGSLVPRGDAAAPGVRLRIPRATLFVRGDDVADAARQIAATGCVDRPMIGVMMDGESNRIEAFLPDSPAEKAGLAEGDRIVAVGPLPVASFADLTRALLRRRSGEKVRLTVERAGSRLAQCVPLVPYATPPAPTTPPIEGAVIELSQDEKGDAVFTLVEVRADSPAAKAGARAGDRLVSVDGRATWRFLQRHRARPAVRPPSRFEVERDGAMVELSVPAQD